MQKKALQPLTPGAQPAAASASVDESPALSPDLQAMVDAEVKRRLGAQLKADAKANPSSLPAYDAVEAEQMALPIEQRKATMTDKGWFVPVGVSRGPKE